MNHLAHSAIFENIENWEGDSFSSLVLCAELLQMFLSGLVLCMQLLQMHFSGDYLGPVLSDAILHTSAGRLRL